MKSNVTPRGTDQARIIEVIETRSLKGAGTEEDPARCLTQFWSFEGELLAEHDSISEDNFMDREDIPTVITAGMICLDDNK